MTLKLPFLRFRTAPCRLMSKAFFTNATLVPLSIYLLTSSAMAADSGKEKKVSVDPTRYELSPLTKSSGNSKKRDLFASRHITVIDFWASWCQSCVTNLEKLEPIARQLKQSRSKAEIVTVNVDESKETATQFFKDQAPNLRSLKPITFWDVDQKLAQQLNFEGVPYLLVIDATGQTLLKHAGPLSKKDLLQIQKLLKLEDNRYAKFEAKN